MDKNVYSGTETITCFIFKIEGEGRVEIFVHLTLFNRSEAVFRPNIHIQILQTDLNHEHISLKNKLREFDKRSNYFTKPHQ